MYPHSTLGYVYALTDGAGRIRYVGQTQQPLSVRRDTHMRTRGVASQKNRALAAWLKELDAQGQQPGIIALHAAPSRILTAIERLEIRIHAELYPDLLNVTYNRYRVDAYNLTRSGHATREDRALTLVSRAHAHDIPPP